jgi:NAD(P)-dependent dehydrogenase (short-subunit alcohol dehydrogenase family)
MPQAAAIPCREAFGAVRHGGGGHDGAAGGGVAGRREPAALLGLAAAPWLLDASVKGWSAAVLLAYGASILSFLGGIQWGLAVARPGGAGLAVRLALSVVPSLAAWLALLLPVRPGLLVRAASLAACWLPTCGPRSAAWRRPGIRSFAYRFRAARWWPFWPAPYDDHPGNDRAARGFGMSGFPAPPSFPVGSTAVVVGATGGIGAAIASALCREPAFARVVALSRSSVPALDLTDEASVAAAAASLDGAEVRLVIDATGFLHDAEHMPERSWRELEAAQMAKAFALNAIGPALLMKHFLPHLPRSGKAVFVALSAKVGSIGDNSVGGWYSYRASKAALNQLVRTAAIELARLRPDAVCVALHPGTVDTPLSAPFAKAGLDVCGPAEAAAQMLAVIDALTSAQNGAFLDYRGHSLPW